MDSTTMTTSAVLRALRKLLVGARRYVSRLTRGCMQHVCQRPGLAVAPRQVMDVGAGAAGSAQAYTGHHGDNLTGEPFALKDYRGKVVAANVWVSWCAPCRAEAPALNQLSRELAPKGCAVHWFGHPRHEGIGRGVHPAVRSAVPQRGDPDAQLQLAFRDSRRRRRFLRRCLSTNRARRWPRARRG